MKKVSFGITSVQKGRRIILDDSLLQNLDIKEGDPVELLLDIREEAIIVKKPHGLKAKMETRQRDRGNLDHE